jgi:hypothetical protein
VITSAGSVAFDCQASFQGGGDKRLGPRVPSEEIGPVQLSQPYDSRFVKKLDPLWRGCNARLVKFVQADEGRDTEEDATRRVCSICQQLSDSRLATDVRQFTRFQNGCSYSCSNLKLSGLIQAYANKVSVWLDKTWAHCGSGQLHYRAGVMYPGVTIWCHAGDTLIGYCNCLFLPRRKSMDINYGCTSQEQVSGHPAGCHRGQALQRGSAWSQMNRHRTTPAACVSEIDPDPVPRPNGGKWLRLLANE